jgi:hypothetical protein
VRLCTKVGGSLSQQANKTQPNIGKGLLRKYDGSWGTALRHALPEVAWPAEGRFAKPASSSPAVHLTQRQELDTIGYRLGVNSLEDWYRFSYRDIKNAGGSLMGPCPCPTATNYLLGSRLLSRYDSSPVALLKATYPDKTWLDWKFRATPKGFWDSPNNCKAFLDWAAVQLHVASPEHWYSVEQKDVVELGGSSNARNTPSCIR